MQKEDMQLNSWYRCIKNWDVAITHQATRELWSLHDLSSLSNESKQILIYRLVMLVILAVRACF